MTEKDLVEKFNREVDQMLSVYGVADMELPAGEYRQAVQMAEQIATTDYSDESKIRMALRRRLLEQATHRTKDGPEKTWRTRMTMKTSKLAMVAIPLLVIAASLFGYLALPTAVAAAESFLLRIGVISISDAPTDADLIVKDFGSAEVDMGVMPAPTPNFTGWGHIQPYSEVSGLLGMPLLIPSVVPSGYELKYQYGHPSYATMTYNMGHGEASLIIDQWALTLYSDQDFEIGDAINRMVAIRGQQALWVEQASIGWINNSLHYDAQLEQVVVIPSAPGQEASTWRLNVLLWEENGRTIRLMADKLSFDEMVEIAESLTTE